MASPAGDGNPLTGPALCYFAKVPQPGLVKTRLCPPLTPAEAAGLYRGFLSDVLRPVGPGRSYVYGYPAAQVDELVPLVPIGCELRPQRGEDLWDRLIACFAELFAAGHEAVVVRNTDSPDLSVDLVERALELCGPGRVVLGPDRGGGYYLIGLAAPQPELFAGLDEGAATVFAATVARAAALGLEVVELEPQTDVDVYADLLALWQGRSSGSK